MLSISDLNGMSNSPTSTMYCLPKDIPFLPTNYKGMVITDLQIDYNNDKQDVQVDSNNLINVLSINNLPAMVDYANIINIKTVGVDENNTVVKELYYKGTTTTNYTSSHYGKLELDSAYQFIGLKNSLSARLNVQNVIDKDKIMLHDEDNRVVGVSKFVLTLAFYDKNKNLIKTIDVTFNINNIARVEEIRNDYYVSNGSTAICILDNNQGLDVYMFNEEYDKWEKLS